MARRAEGISTTAAKEDGNRATVHTLIVDELVAVVLTLFFAPVKPIFSLALIALEVFSFDIIFLLHGLQAVLRATEVVLSAPKALKKGVGVYSKGC